MSSAIWTVEGVVFIEHKYIENMEGQDFIVNVMNYSEAVGRNPDNCKILLNRCDYFLKVSQTELALNDALRVLEIDSSCRIAYYRLMDCHILLGNNQQASDVLKNFRQLAPHIDTVNTNQAFKIDNALKLEAEIKSSKKANNFGKALQLIDEALKISPSSVDLLFEKIRYLIALDRSSKIKKAENELFKVLKDRPRIVESLQHYYKADLARSILLLKQISEEITDRIQPLKTLKAKIETMDDEIKRGALILILFSQVYWSI